MMDIIFIRRQIPQDPVDYSRVPRRYYSVTDDKETRFHMPFLFDRRRSSYGSRAIPFKDNVALIPEGMVIFPRTNLLSPDAVCLAKDTPVTLKPRTWDQLPSTKHGSFVS